MKQILVLTLFALFHVNCLFSQNREFQILEIDGNTKGTITIVPRKTIYEKFLNYLLGKDNTQSNPISCKGIINECDYIVWGEHKSIKIQRKGSAARSRVITKKDMDKYGAYTIKDFDCPSYGNNRQVVVSTTSGRRTISEIETKTISPDFRVADTTLVRDKNRLALLIGNELYGNEKELATPVNDVCTIRDTLCSLGFDTYVAKNLSSQGLEWFINDFSATLLSQKAYDVILLYYAGHGSIQKNKGNQFVDHIISIDSVSKSLESIVKVFSNKKQKRFIVYDACRNGKDSCRSNADYLRVDNLLALFSVKDGLQAKDKFSDDYKVSPFAHLFEKFIGQEGKDATEVFRQISDSMQVYNDDQISGDVIGKPGYVHFKFKPAVISKKDSFDAYSYLGGGIHYIYNNNYYHHWGGSVHYGCQFRPHWFGEVGLGLIGKNDNVIVINNNSFKYNSRVDIFGRIGYNFNTNWLKKNSKVAPYAEVLYSYFFSSEKMGDAAAVFPSLNSRLSLPINRSWDFYVSCGVLFPHFGWENANYKIVRDKSSVGIDNISFRIYAGLNYRL